METVEHILEATIAALPRDFAWLLTCLLLLVAARLVKDLLTPYRLKDELTERDNPAIGMSVAGYYTGVLAVILGPMHSPSQNAIPWWEDLLHTAGYAAAGIVLLNVARLASTRVLWSRIDNTKELVEDQNAGLGAVEGGVYVASGLVIAGALHGHGGGPETALVFFVLGQMALLLYALTYRAVCGYDLIEEIAADNVAAGVALALNMIAMGVVLMGAASGDFTGWTVNVGRFTILALLGGTLLMTMRVFVGRILLSGSRVKAEIVRDRNTNVAWVEGVVLTGMAGLLVIIL